MSSSRHRSPLITTTSRSLKCRKDYSRKSRSTILSSGISDLPAELIVHIFSFLTPADLTVVGTVCRVWYNLAQDRMLWRDHYTRRWSPGSGSGIESMAVHGGDVDWRTSYFRKVAKLRDRYIKKMTSLGISSSAGKQNKLKTVDTRRVLGYLGVRWILSLKTNSSSNERDITLTDDSAVVFEDGTTAVWTNASLGTTDVGTAHDNDITYVKCLRIYATLAPLANLPTKPPLSHDESSMSSLKTAYQPSLRMGRLLVSEEINRLKRLEAVEENDLITLHVLGCILVGIWRDSWPRPQLAFVMANIPNASLIERILHSSHISTWRPPLHQSRFDDVDPLYGLHGYAVAVTFRSARKIKWAQMFSEQYVRDARCLIQRRLNNKVTNGCEKALLELIRVEDTSYYFPGRLGVAWSTDAFRCIMNSVVLVDLVIKDEYGEVFCHFSAPLSQLTGPQKGDGPVEVGLSHVDVDFENNDREHTALSYTCSETGVVFKAILLYHSTNNQTAVHYLSVGLPLNHINSWFSTRY